MNKKLLKRWSIAATIFMMLIGTLSHFAYEFSGNNCIVGIFTPLSESVWEHLKLAFYPLLIFSILDWFFIKDIANNYFIGKALGIITCSLFIVIVFYAYNYFVHHSIIFVDISLFFIGCILSQIVCYKIFTHKSLGINIEVLGIVLIILQISLFTIFTFNPPKNLDLFKNPVEASSYFHLPYNI